MKLTNKGFRDVRRRSDGSWEVVWYPVPEGTKYENEWVRRENKKVLKKLEAQEDEYNQEHGYGIEGLRMLLRAGCKPYGKSPQDDPIERGPDTPTEVGLSANKYPCFRCRIMTHALKTWQRYTTIGRCPKCGGTLFYNTISPKKVVYDDEAVKKKDN